MQLSYRGVKYDYTPPTVETAPSEIAGKYRGIDVRFRTQSKDMVQQPTIELKYRGAAYTTSSEEQARTWTISRQHQRDNRQLSMLNRLRQEVLGC